MNDQDEIAALLARIDELEQSNRALWAWVKTLASQDSMLISFAATLANPKRERPTPEVAEEMVKITDQIIDNNRLINNLPVPENDE